MNRKISLRRTILTGALLTLPIGWLIAAPGMVGKYDLPAWQALNKSAGAKLAAIPPTDAPLQEDDAKLMLEVSAGGTSQLELSRLALKKTGNPDVKAYAMAEVEEQEGLAKKLAEISKAKGMAPKVGTTKDLDEMLAKLDKLSGADFDKAYLKEAGVDGHKKLEKTMEKVEAKSKDATLKELAATALPLVKTHLQTADDELGDL